MAALPTICLFCMGAIAPTGHACGDRPDLAILRCEDCGLVRVSDFAHATIEHYAANDYFLNDDTPVYAGEAHWKVKRIELCLARLPAPGRRKVLDFGCGIGGFLKRATPHLQASSGSTCRSGFDCVSDLAGVPTNVDTIVLFHVLEHAPELRRLLVDLVARFAGVDRVVVEVRHTSKALLAWFGSEPDRCNHYSADHLY